MLCLIFIFPMRMNGGTLLGELSLSNDFLSVGDINVSVLCPKGGINGSNKYTLNMATYSGAYPFTFRQLIRV